MSTLMRAKAALMLVALLLTTGAGPVALAAPSSGSAQQAVGIVALRHAADGVQTRIILEGTAELPYTIYRPDERTILVDLPGVDASKLDDGYAVESPGVEGIQVERLRTASGQSLARLRIRLKAPVEDRTVVEGKNLVLTLTATAVVASKPAPERGREPAALRAEAPAASKPASEPVAPLRPVTSAMVPTAAATVISDVTTEVQNGVFRAFIATDGRASFKHFVLPNPDRIVVDITGVTSRVERNALEVKGGGISRIRIGQFRTADPRVVRIVFDVAKMESYEVRQVGNNLVLAMGPGAKADAPAPATARRPAPEPVQPRAEAPASSAPKPTRTPIVAEDDGDVPAAVKPAPRTEAPKPEAPRPSAAPVQKPEPARNPVVAPPSATVRPVAETAEPQTASGRPAPRPPVPANTGRSSQQPMTQAPPPAPITPRTQDGEAGYLTEGFVGRPVNLELKNVDLRDVLRFLHNRFNVNFIVDKSVPASVPIDVSIKDIPWNQALDAILKAQGLGAVREDGGIIRIAALASIATEDKLRREIQAAYFNTLPLVTKIYKLKYISPIPNTRFSGLSGSSGGGGGGGSNQNPESIRTGIVAFIRNRLSARGRIEFDIRSNSIVVTDLASRLAVVEELIRVLDRPEPQVEIEARIVIARRTFIRDLGVQLTAGVSNPSRGAFAGQFSNGGANGTRTSLSATLPPNSLVPATIPATGSVFSLTTGMIGTFQISAFVIASERKGQIRTIASPRVTTQNNTTAEITNGVQIPVQTVSNNTVTTTFVDAALELEITPQIIVEDGAVLLSVRASNNSVSELRTVGGTPGIDTQSASAIVLVPDGGTTVLGGINIDQESQSDDRTPGLSRIPIFGNLFKRRTTNRDTQEILFFITPRIFRPELVGLTSESSLRTNDITISPVLPAGSEGIPTPLDTVPTGAPEPDGGGGINP